MIAKTGLLILTNPGHIGKILPAVTNQVQNTLYIQLINALHEPFVGYRSNVFTSAPMYSQTVRGIYSAAATFCQNLDVRVLLSGFKYPKLANITTRPVDVVIFDKLHEKYHIDNFLKMLIMDKKHEYSIITLEEFETSDDNQLPVIDNSKEYKHVVLGGTFDRLHIGHKLLLTEAVLRATEKVTVGVTDTNMLNGKILWELIEPCATRLESVRNFLKDVCPYLEYNIVPIQDLYGPTQFDPTMEMIVVSKETVRGGFKINEIREKSNLKPLDIVTVDLVDCPDRLADEEEKISSSTNRMRLLGSLLKDVSCTEMEKEPYVIGLTGGIASGKSSISERLSKMGAAIINCDKVAHSVYRRGEPCHSLIREHFGEGVVDESGEINRKALGAIVFHDKHQLEKLNSIVWPAIANAVKKQIDELYEQGYKVVVIEAAVLLQANWDKMCHEVWTCVIPPEEAVKRLKNRNNLNEDEARARISSQPSNTNNIEKANVVFCTFWSPDYTQQIVERAWQLLMERISNTECNNKQCIGNKST